MIGLSLDDFRILFIFMNSRGVTSHTWSAEVSLSSQGEWVNDLHCLVHFRLIGSHQRRATPLTEEIQSCSISCLQNKKLMLKVALAAGRMTGDKGGDFSS